ncbi:MAG: hypothetical protein J7501_08690 [Bdellovibrio sp.]|nr:hypothetical protein [Bdellovibrio sp.]
MKALFAALGVLSVSVVAMAEPGLTCSSNDSKLSFNIVEAKDKTPVSSKLFYRTDAPEGTDGVTHSFDFKNSKTKKVITYSSADGEFVVVFQSDNNVIAAKVTAASMHGKAQAMVAGEASTMDLACVRE